MMEETLPIHVLTGVTYRMSFSLCKVQLLSRSCTEVHPHMTNGELVLSFSYEKRFFKRIVGTGDVFLCLSGNSLTQALDWCHSVKSKSRVPCFSWWTTCFECLHVQLGRSFPLQCSVTHPCPNADPQKQTNICKFMFLWLNLRQSGSLSWIIPVFSWTQKYLWASAGVWNSWLPSWLTVFTLVSTKPLQVKNVSFLFFFFSSELSFVSLSILNVLDLTYNKLLISAPLTSFVMFTIGYIMFMYVPEFEITHSCLASVSLKKTWFRFALSYIFLNVYFVSFVHQVIKSKK